MTQLAQRLRSALTVLALSGVLAACGGGGGGGGGTSDGGGLPGGPTPANGYEISLRADATQLPLNVGGVRPGLGGYSGIGANAPYTTALYVSATRAGTGDPIPGGTDVFGCNVLPGIEVGSLMYLDGNTENEVEVVIGTDATGGDITATVPGSFRSITLDANSGAASFHFHAGATAGTATIVCTVTDPQTGQSVSASQQIVVGGSESGLPSQVRINASGPNALFVQGINGQTQLILQAQVLDEAGQPVPNPPAGVSNLTARIVPSASSGAYVGAELRAGAQSGQVVSAATINGQAQFTLVSGVATGNIAIEFLSDRADNNVSNGIATTVLNAFQVPVVRAVASSPLAIATATVPGAFEQTPYVSFLEASGGVPPYNWRLLSGSRLPSGLTLSADGVLQGTPTELISNLAFGVVVRDDLGTETSTTYSISVASVFEALSIASGSLPNAAFGVPYAAALSATGGRAPYIWSATNLPGGLALDAANGIISGSPSVGGTFNFVLSVTDSLGRRANASASLTVDDAPDGGDTVIGGQLRLLASDNQVQSDGANTVTLQAFLTNESNAALPEKNVVFEASSGVISPASALTNEAGIATATWSVGNDFSNRTVTVTARINGAEPATTTFSVIGTSLTIDGQTSIGLNAGTPLPLTLTLRDAANRPLANEAVTLSVSSNGSLSATQLTTGFDGVARTTLDATAPGDITVTATALGTVTATLTVKVDTEDLALSLETGQSTSAVNIAECKRVVLSGTNLESPINYATTRGRLYRGDPTCAGGGSATVTSATSGDVIYIRSTEVGAAVVQVVVGPQQRTATLGLTFVATTPAPDGTTIVVSPSSLGIGDTATVTVTVRDANGNPVPNLEVAFSGGVLSPATSRTNPNGIATSTLTADNATQQGGQTITATILQAPPDQNIIKSTTVTVSNRGVRVSLGFDNLVEKVAAPTVYRKRFTAVVSDINGTPVPNADVTISVDVPSFYKGFYYQGVETWVQLVQSQECSNEDTNRNGLLESAEDINANGQLDPVHGVVVVPETGVPGSTVTIRTREDGTADLILQYPQNQAGWLDASITGTATVSGATSSTVSRQSLVALADDLSDIEVQPPNVVSPYGYTRQGFSVDSTTTPPTINFTSLGCGDNTNLFTP